MKVTFILKDLSDTFYNGNESGSIRGINQMPVDQRFNYLSKSATGDLRGHIKMKIGNDSFRDRVDLNGMLRNLCTFNYKQEPRKGYNLITFDIK